MTAVFMDRAEGADSPLRHRLLRLNWWLVACVCLIAIVGVAVLYSAAGGAWRPWAIRHVARFGVGLALMVSVAVVSIHLWMRYAYALYAIALGLLVVVAFAGDVGMGAQRWIDLGLFRLQPSELMKPALALALARAFHGMSAEDLGRPIALVMPALLVVAPIVLVMRQPDLGTAALIALGAVAIFFLAGLRWWLFAGGFALGLAILPLGWAFLRDYQKTRILTFLNPESDPLGAGYHILQSKITVGSGGMFGKGFLQGSQGHLNFLPEQHTDFAFTMLSEEFGFLGGCALLLLYLVAIGLGYAIGLRSRSRFGCLMALGMTTFLALYVITNAAMVMGLLPVVGVPLPLVSYGGSAMLSVMVGFGFILNAHVHGEARLPRHWAGPG